MQFSDYISNAKMAGRIFLLSSPRLIWKFVNNFGWKSYLSMNRFEKRLEKGEPFFPAFYMVSITEACNLGCQGCWVSQNGRRHLTPKQLDGIIREGKKTGSYFYGLLGGEPLMYNGLFEVLEQHPDCYFQIFTNGTLLTDEIAMRMEKLGNITPVISIEGLEDESDRRRERSHVFERSMDGLRSCRKAGLIFGAACSICNSNFDELVSRSYIEQIAKEGAMYLWYYIYRPVGAEAHPEKALSKEQIRNLRLFLVEQRKNAPLVLIDTYWDDKGNAICPGATGMSHHIGPSGAVEFCPPLQLAKDFLNEDASNLKEASASEFLEDMRDYVAQTTRGCILMNHPQDLLVYLKQHDAVDTTSRGTVAAEFSLMPCVATHDMEDEPIAEQNPFYRFLKKRYFFGFGAYG